jgi:hypothetical protein
VEWDRRDVGRVTPAAVSALGLVARGRATLPPDEHAALPELHELGLVKGNGMGGLEPTETGWELLEMLQPIRDE